MGYVGIAAVLVILEAVFCYRLNREKISGKWLLLLVAITLLTIVIVGLGYRSQYNDLKRTRIQLDELSDQNQQQSVANDSLNLRIDTLTADLDTVKNELNEMSTIMGRLADVAHTTFPGLKGLSSKETVDSLIPLLSGIEKSVTAITPRLDYLENRAFYSPDSILNLVHGVFPFRAVNGELRDVLIWMWFAGILDSVSYRFDGLIRMDYATQLKKHEDHRGFTFYTGIMTPYSDLLLDVWAEEQIRLDSVKWSFN